MTLLFVVSLVRDVVLPVLVLWLVLLLVSLRAWIIFGMLFTSALISLSTRTGILSINLGRAFISPSASASVISIPCVYD